MSNSDQQIDEEYSRLLREGKDAKSKDKERLELFEILIRHPGWKLLMEMAAGRKQELADQILAPEEDEFALIRNVGLKGEMRGILFLETTLGRTIAGLKAQFGDEQEE